MSDPATGEAQTRLHVRHLQVGQFLHDLLGTEAVGQQVKHVTDTDAHAANARFPPTLIGINRNALGEVRHILGSGFSSSMICKAMPCYAFSPVQPSTIEQKTPAGGALSRHAGRG
jgi:hypothetical protein